MSELFSSHPVGIDKEDSEVSSWVNTTGATGKSETNTSSYYEWNCRNTYASITRVRINFDFSAIPSNYKVLKVTLRARCMTSNTSFVPSRRVHLKNAYGDDYTASDIQSFGTSPKVVTIASTAVTREELNSMYMLISSSHAFGSRPYYIRMYGATCDVECEAPNGTKVMFRTNDRWFKASKILYKQNGVWIDYTNNVDQLLENGTQYLIKNFNYIEEDLPE